MSLFITDIAVSRNQAEEQQLQLQGFSRTFISLKLDDRGNFVSVWKKKSPDQAPITRIQFSFNQEMSEGLKEAGFSRIENPFITADGAVFVWVFRGNSRFDVRIIDQMISLTPRREAELFRGGWEKVGCNISPVLGGAAFFWVKREKQTYIGDLTATNSYDKDAELFKAGFIRLDETTNTVFSGYRSSNFLWYRLSADTESRVVHDLQISSSSEDFQQNLLQRLQLIDVNLNHGTGGRTVFLWTKPWLEQGETEDDFTLVKNLTLLHHRFIIQEFEEAGITVIKKNLNQGNSGLDRYLCFIKETKTEGQ